METETIVVKCGHTIKIQLKCTLIDMRLEIFDNLCKKTQNYQDCYFEKMVLISSDAHLTFWIFPRESKVVERLVQSHIEVSCIHGHAVHRAGLPTPGRGCILHVQVARGPHM